MFPLIDLQRIDDPRGSLTVAQGFPFDVKRVYWLHGIQGGAKRGGHTHRALHRWLIAVSGALTVRLDCERATLRLNDPAKALYVAPMRWLELEDFSPHAVCLVLASAEYDPEDYIRDEAHWRRVTGRA